MYLIFKTLYWFLCLNVVSVVLVLTSQADDRHPAPAVHRKQRDCPAKEGQWHSAFPIWTWIQEGHQHRDQQEVEITPLTPAPRTQ